MKESRSKVRFFAKAALIQRQCRAFAGGKALWVIVGAYLSKGIGMASQRQYYNLVLGRGRYLRNHKGSADAVRSG